MDGYMDFGTTATITTRRTRTRTGIRHDMRYTTKRRLDLGHSRYRTADLRHAPCSGLGMDNSREEATKGWADISRIYSCRRRFCRSYVFVNDILFASLILGCVVPCEVKAFEDKLNFVVSWG